MLVRLSTRLLLFKTRCALAAVNHPLVNGVCVACCRLATAGSNAGAASVACEASEFAGKHFFVEAVPVALESLIGIELLFLFQELHKLRIALLHLLARGPVVVGEVVAASVLNRASEIGRASGRERG